MSAVRKGIPLALVAMAAACGSSGAPPPLPDASPIVFIAFTTTFQPFRTWTSFHDPGPPDDGTFPADVLGPRTQYINKLPIHGETEFPIGTIIVEARENAAMEIFAGVKRGDDFNATGALNWVWFELSEDPGTGEVLIVWRGVGPPSNAFYGGDPNGGCNACHISCGAGNDFVCSPELQLAKF